MIHKVIIKLLELLEHCGDISRHDRNFFFLNFTIKTGKKTFSFELHFLHFLIVRGLFGTWTIKRLNSLSYKSWCCQTLWWLKNVIILNVEVTYFRSVCHDQSQSNLIDLNCVRLIWASLVLEGRFSRWSDLFSPFYLKDDEHFAKK